MKNLFIDPGHGGADPGATGNNLKEKDINLKIALLVGGLLMENYEVDIEFSRMKDQFVTLSDRVLKAVQFDADWFISFHSNAHTNTEANGYEDYIHPAASGKSQYLRDKFHPEVAQLWRSYSRQNRGKRTANFLVLRQTPMPAMLLENGFISNPIDAGLLKNDEFIDLLCNQIATNIANALDLQRKAPVIAFADHMQGLLQQTNKIEVELEILQRMIATLKTEL